jgi:LysR family carnitine catabolism transcriptional activator
MSSRETVSLRQLHFFITLARLGSFSRTADAAAITQPALSAAIRQLETQLDVRLFERTTHKVTLTSAGKQLLPHAERLLHTAEHSFGDMRAAVSGHRASVRVGATPSTMHILARAVADVQATGVAAKFHISDGTAGTLIGQVRSGELDFVMAVLYEPADDLEIEHLMTDELVLVVNRQHRFAREKTVPWSALASEDVAHFRQGSIATLSASALRQHALAASPRYHVEQIASLYGLVQAGLAVGIMPRLYARDLENADVTLTQLSDPVVRRRIALVRHRHQRAEHQLAAQCYDEILKVIAGAAADELRAGGPISRNPDGT